MALSSEKVSTFYNAGVEIAGTEGELTGFGATEIWTVVDNGDGSYSFQQNGQNIGLAESYTSMDLGAAYDDWEVISLGDGLYLSLIHIWRTMKGLLLKDFYNIARSGRLYLAMLLIYGCLLYTSRCV